MVKYYRTKKACQVCGKSFYGGYDCFYCPDCARDKKLDTVVRIRTCQDCGTEFYGGPRARRCPQCAHVAAIKYKPRKTIRPIGSVDKCAICGEEYIVRSGKQKYCSEICQRKGVLEWQREHKKDYHKERQQKIKKQERRDAQIKICIYCLKPFKSDTATNLCSDYCRTEHIKLRQCLADVKRGQKRNLDQYLEKREDYRKQVSSEKQPGE